MAFHSWINHSHRTLHGVKRQELFAPQQSSFEKTAWGLIGLCRGIPLEDDCERGRSRLKHSKPPQRATLAATNNTTRVICCHHDTHSKTQSNNWNFEDVVLISGILIEARSSKISAFKSKIFNSDILPKSEMWIWKSHNFLWKLSNFISQICRHKMKD